MASGTRERIVQAGLELFERFGFAHVGLDQVLQQAELTKTTFYNHFESKEELVRAAIDQREATVVAHLDEGLARMGGEDPQSRLLAVFDVLQENFRRPQVSRCLLICAMIEFPSSQDPIFQTAVGYRNRRIARYRQLASEAGVAEPETFSSQFAMLTEGAILDWQIAKNQNAAQDAKRVATLLLRDSLA